MPTIDLDDEFLDLFFNLTNSRRPKNIELQDLKKQLIVILETLKELNENTKKPLHSRALGNLNELEEEQTGPAILVVDDLGVITYQLKVLLSQFDIDVDCSQEIYDAVNKYKKRKYAYVVMDLFIPTEREGYILLTELKKMAQINNVEIVIGVITASARKEMEAQCRARGADFFLEKNSDWQQQLCKIMSEYINTEEDEDDF